MAKKDAVRVTGPMCRWGMKATDERTGCSGFVRKQTAWMTNHPGLAEVLEGWCSCVNEDGSVPYRHVHVSPLRRPPIPRPSSRRSSASWESTWGTRRSSRTSRR